MLCCKSSRILSKKKNIVKTWKAFQHQHPFYFEHTQITIKIWLLWIGRKWTWRLKGANHICWIFFSTNFSRCRWRHDDLYFLRSAKSINLNKIKLLIWIFGHRKEEKQIVCKIRNITFLLCSHVCEFFS